MHPEQIGIVDIKIALPQKRMFLADMAELLGEECDRLFKEIGIQQKPVLSPGENIGSLALEAVNNLLAENRVNHNEIDFIIHASCGIQDKQLWSPSAKIQKSIKAKNAFSFDIQNGCNAGNLALEIASHFLRADKTKKIALIVVADAMSGIVDYRNPLHKCIFGMSDGASAILLCKNSKKNTLLSFSASTESLFADSMYLRKGDPHVWMKDDPEEDKMLIKEYEERYSQMIKESLHKISKKVEDAKYIVMNQGDHKLINKLIKKFNYSKDRIFRSHENYGHLGGTDIFFGLNQLIENGSLSSGDFVVLASSAIGFSWGASVIQV